MIPYRTWDRLLDRHPADVFAIIQHWSLANLCFGRYQVRFFLAVNKLAKVADGRIKKGKNWPHFSCWWTFATEKSGRSKPLWLASDINHDEDYSDPMFYMVAEEMSQNFLQSYDCPNKYNVMDIVRNTATIEPDFWVNQLSPLQTLTTRKTTCDCFLALRIYWWNVWFLYMMLDWRITAFACLLFATDERPDQQVSPEDIIKHARRSLAGFKCPKEVVFRELPKTATGEEAK